MTRKFSAVLLALLLLFTFYFQAFGQKPVKDLKPTVILISLDGFRSDYIEKFNPPTLKKLVKNGVRAKWMIPSYPTKTFPNHYTVATGLYPDNHGIIENNMFDADINAVFGLRIREQVQNPLWWGGEPIWVTAEQQGQIAASFFFPGTETLIKGKQPEYWKPYEHTLPNEERVDTVLSWLDLPREKRPTMITMYFSDVDDAGHGFGTDAEETRRAVLKVDESLNRLMQGLKARKIDKKVNLIIVSDHGMASYRLRDAVILDEFFDPNDAERIFWIGEFTQIFPKEGKEEKIYNDLKSKLPANVSVYRRGDFPERFKFGKNKRIAPIVVTPTEGIYITNKARYKEDEARGLLDKTRGGHGYDNAFESMRAIFIAHGSAFKKGAVVEPFENVNVYNLMCKILNLKPAPNDGNRDLAKEVLR
jgi:Uncharacterized proteins of the AP superfamily